MSINARAKGARVERKWRDFCREHGFTDVRRTVQYCGKTGDASDCVGLPNIHQEVKGVEKLNVRAAYAQAKHDAERAGNGDIPIVAWKKQYQEWLVILSAEDWFKIYKESELSNEK